MRTASKVAVQDFALMQEGHAGHDVRCYAEHRRHARRAAGVPRVLPKLACLNCRLRTRQHPSWPEHYTPLDTTQVTQEHAPALALAPTYANSRPKT